MKSALEGVQRYELARAGQGASMAATADL